MKVLVVHNAYQSKHIGGEDLVVSREIAGLIAALGKDNVFVYRKSNDQIKSAKLIKTIWGDREHANAIQDLIKTHQINIVHVHNFFPLLTPLIFQAAKSAGAYVIHTLHNFRWWCAAGTFYREGKGHCMACVGKAWGYPAVLHGCYRQSHTQSMAASLAFYWYQLKQYRKAIDAYFVLTQFQKTKLAECGLHDNIWLKPNPIPDTKISVPTNQKSDYLFVGRIESAKGIDALLAVWQTLPDHFTLHIVGEGDRSQKLLQQYHRANILFCGNQSHENVLKRMAKSRYFIHTGLAYETFGLTLVEAMSQGTPVIGFNIGTRPEFIQHGKNGYLSDVAGLRNVLLQSDENPHYDNMSQAAIETAEPFLLPKVIDHQVRLYQSLLAKQQVAS